MTPQHKKLTREEMIDKYNHSNLVDILPNCEMVATEKVLPHNGLTRRQENYKDPATGKLKLTKILEKRENGEYVLTSIVFMEIAGQGYIVRRNS